jgi:hypothetical protein
MMMMFLQLLVVLLACSAAAARAQTLDCAACTANGLLFSRYSTPDCTGAAETPVKSVMVGGCHAAQLDAGYTGFTNSTCASDRNVMQHAVYANQTNDGACVNLTSPGSLNVIVDTCITLLATMTSHQYSCAAPADSGGSEGAETGASSSGGGGFSFDCAACTVNAGFAGTVTGTDCTGTQARETTGCQYSECPAGYQFSCVEPKKEGGNAAARLAAAPATALAAAVAAVLALMR